MMRQPNRAFDLARIERRPIRQYPIEMGIVAANAAVPAAPETVNQDAYAAWLFRIKPADPAAMDALLDARGYQAVIGD